MREYISNKFIVETLQSHPGQAFTRQELSNITEIPLKTITSQLRRLVRKNIIQKKTVILNKWNKRKDKQYEQPQIWYFLEVKDATSPPST